MKSVRPCLDRFVMVGEADSSGPLKDWYAHEKIFGLQETREMIQRRVSGKVKFHRSD